MRLAYKKIRNDTDFDLKEFKERLEADRTFIDEEGSDEQLMELLRFGMEDDIMVVESLNDISAVNKKVMDILQHLAMKNMYIEAIKENLSTASDTGNVMNFILSMMGHLDGKEEINYTNTPEEKHEDADKEGLFKQLYHQYKSGHLSPVAFRKKLHVSKEELERMIDEYENY